MKILIEVDTCSTEDEFIARLEEWLNYNQEELSRYEILDKNVSKQDFLFDAEKDERYKDIGKTAHITKNDGSVIKLLIVGFVTNLKDGYICATPKNTDTGWKSLEPTDYVNPLYLNRSFQYAYKESIKQITTI